MSRLRRYYGPNQYCFITAVTMSRLPLLVRHFDLLVDAVKRARAKSRFRLIAWVVLPDHLHVIFHCPSGDTAKIVQRIKLSFSLQLRSLTGCQGPMWQHRYWDHVIRTEEDFNRHLDYIHYNPVKHRRTASAAQWSLSSFRDFVRHGYYSRDWGRKERMSDDGSFGE
jgi:putative transposase